jgi:hypothetical protein
MYLININKIKFLFLYIKKIDFILKLIIIQFFDNLDILEIIL